MQNKHRIGLVCLVMTALLLSACGSSGESLTPTLDPVLVNTQAAQTVSAQFTQTSYALTAAAPTQTNTPAPTPTIAASPSPFATAPLFTAPVGLLPLATLTPTFSILPKRERRPGYYVTIPSISAMLARQMGRNLSPASRLQKAGSSRTPAPAIGAWAIILCEWAVIPISAEISS